MTYNAMMNAIGKKGTRARRPHWPETIWLVDDSGPGLGGWIWQCKWAGDPELIKQWRHMPSFQEGSIASRERDMTATDWEVVE